MARLFWLIIVLAFVGLMFTGVSWAAAFTSVGTFLGAPPPQMGSQKTTIEWHGQWHGLAQIREHPPVWRFAFSPTVIPGAPAVRIYVDPVGHIIATEPADLEARLVAFRRTPY
jgi:hypothetical protein